MPDNDARPTAAAGTSRIARDADGGHGSPASRAPPGTQCPTGHPHAAMQRKSAATLAADANGPEPFLTDGRPTDGAQQRTTPMASINTNVNSLVAQRVLKRNNDQLNTALERLSTGLKINSGADNPAGLIASENLRAEQTGIKSALRNAERAGNVIATAEGGLAEVSNLLNELQGLVTETANTGGLSGEEIEANQLQVDAILGTINRLSGSVNFQGEQLLNGEKDYQVSGTDTASFANLRVNSASAYSSSQAIQVDVVAGAERANLSGLGFTAGTDATNVIEVSGSEGSAQITLASTATQANVIDAINAVSAQTGVEAIDDAGTTELFSEGFGSKSFVNVKVVAGDATFTGTGTAEGTDADVLVNGSQAQSDGLSVSFRNGSLDVEFDLIDDGDDDPAAGTGSNLDGFATTDLQVDGGGATFSLGSKVSEGDFASIGIASVSTGTLGLSGDSLSSLGSGGDNSLSGNLTKAQEVLDTAIGQISQTRGRLGSFQKFVINSTSNQLGVALENAAAAESAIRDADFAHETAALTRGQILAQASTTVLAQANQQPQRVLSLLG